MAMLSIDGVELPNPSSYSVMLADIDSSASRANGYLKRNRIREGVYKIKVGWTALTPEEVSNITTSLKPASFEAVFFAPTPSFSDSARMYAGDRQMDLSKHTDETKPQESRWDLSVNLVEF